MAKVELFEFTGTYLQYITYVLFTKNNTFQDLCYYYNAYFHKDPDQGFKVATLQRVYRDKSRGNLPEGVTPEIFYDCIIANCCMSPDERCDLSKRLLEVLDDARVFPKQWVNKRDALGQQYDGKHYSDDIFDDNTFHEFILYLLKHNKASQRLVDDDRSIVLTREPAAVCQPKGGATQSASPLAFSSRFFNSGAKAIMHADDAAFCGELSRMSTVFFPLVDLTFTNEAEAFIPHSDDLLCRLAEYILTQAERGTYNDIAKVKGPLGSYKNRVMQYVYLAVERRAENVLPFYIDLASYERFAKNGCGIDEQAFLNAFTEDMKTVEAIAADRPDKKLLIVLDGVRDFFYRKEMIYYSIHTRLKQTGALLVVCMDTEFTVNEQRKYSVHPLVSTHFGAYVRIRSMNLIKRDASIAFIKNCIDVFRVPIPHSITVETIYDNLVRLQFLTIDAYWLVYMLRANLTSIVNPNSKLADLYHDFCLQYLQPHELLESACEFAYQFELGTSDISCNTPYFDLRWRLIRQHRSVLDFLIAKHYIKKVSELNLQHNTPDENRRNLKFFNMVLQKNITRFVVPMLNGNDDYEHQIMIIAKDYYNDLKLFGKSELTFWMARLGNTTRKKDCIRLLGKFKDDELARYRTAHFEDEKEKRDTVFLIRGICVSLIYENDRDALVYYLNSLINDKTANSVNRGFHLEYYGDKPYIPNKALLDFEDDVKKGEATLTALCLSLNSRINSGKRPPLVALLEIMTICNLLQARMEYRDDHAAMSVGKYIDKCRMYIEWIFRQHVNWDGLRDVCVYFNWMHAELERLKTVKFRHSADTANILAEAMHVERAGWVSRKVPHPENIVEHMYNCWMIGMLYLPESVPEEGYNKNDILKILLIHDWAESETGDTDRTEKRKDPAGYAQTERTVMRDLFLSGTYPNAVNLTDHLHLWDCFDEKSNINGKIARDIDNIQTIYQACQYALDYPELFPDEDILYWLSGIDRLHTGYGRDIAERLITNNPKFSRFHRL